MAYYRKQYYKRRKKTSYQPPARSITKICVKHGNLIGKSGDTNSPVYEFVKLDGSGIGLGCRECIIERHTLVEKASYEKKLKAHQASKEKYSPKIRIYKWSGFCSAAVGLLIPFLIWNMFDTSPDMFNDTSDIILFYLFLGAPLFITALLFFRHGERLKEFIKTKPYESFLNVDSVVRKEIKEQFSKVDAWRNKEREKRKQRIDFTFEEIDKMSGLQFEQYIVNVLLGNGFQKAELTKASGDEGVDILAYRGNKKYAIQCKRYSNKLGNKAVQEVYSGKNFHDADECMVITNQYFTQNAIILAKKNEVTLINRDGLNDMIENAISKEKESSQIMEHHTEMKEQKPTNQNLKKTLTSFEVIKKKREDTLKAIDRMNLVEFQEIIMDILQKQGFIRITPTSESGYIIAAKENKNYVLCSIHTGSKIMVQCVEKAYVKIQEHQADECLILTNNWFSDRALKAASEYNIKTVNRYKLYEWIQDDEMIVKNSPI